MKHLNIGIFAQVDAGKTTLSEALLYCSGQLRKLGRVDHRDSFLDTHGLERSRGITIFSKEARFQTEHLSITLLDTPGHIDFSPEAERTMQVLDYGILLISGTDSVQPHTQTLWKLLRRYHIPTFLFFNKMDLPGADRGHLLQDAKKFLDAACTDIADQEAIALCEESVMEYYLEEGDVTDSQIADLAARELLFPCFFGSALKLEGVEELLSALERYTVQPHYGEEFAARVFKISRDAQGHRLNFLKVTGGCLQVRSLLRYKDPDGQELEEKITQLRQYSGASFTQVDSVPAGQICAVLGPSALVIGTALGAARKAEDPMLAPVMSYRIHLPIGADIRVVLPKLKQLEEEDPQLQIIWDEQLRQLRARLMGQVQIEVLQSLIRERFDLEVTMDSPMVSYRETITDTVEGVGHFEPLRHYAEVHLILEPLPRGSGLQFGSVCSEDALDRNWQRLIMTHLSEKTHLGVLTGAPITDMRISLAAGRAHIKHTEGGDFRQATYRAVRQGLMQAESLLLEPFYDFTLKVPTGQIGRAIQDIKTMGGRFDPPEQEGELSVLRGFAPVAELQDYMSQLISYTAGKGQLSCQVSGYEPCHNAEKVIVATGYDAESDLQNSPDSVFCSHGSGINIKWDQVFSHMHLESVLREKKEEALPLTPPPVRRQNLDLDEKELQKIIEREFGPEKRILYRPPAAVSSPHVELPTRKNEYLIVDGYNMIFAWDGLRQQAQEDLAGARERLLDLLSNYRGFHPCELVVVFDSYRVKGGLGSKTKQNGLKIVFTKENESADLYIEALVGRIGRNYAVKVATSDALIQLSALRSGVLRISAKELLDQIERTDEQIAQVIKQLRLEAQRGDKVYSPMQQLKKENSDI